jgi:hypothetical protein
MQRAIALVFLCGLCIPACRACPAWQQLSVKLFNDAALGNAVLETAQEEAAWVLRSACVNVTWVPCPVVTRANLSPCEAPAQSPELHILPSPLTSDARRNAIGLAFPRVGSGGRAGVFLSRVRETVDSEPAAIDVPQLLGHVMAHEIGHLLLGSSVHSDEGIMRADFRRPDLKKAAQRQLLFTPDQISAIQRRLLAEAP